MEQHPVPQHISSYQFRLVGDMTLKQFFQLAAGGLIGLLIYSTGLPNLIKWPLIFFFVIMGIALAFLPLRDRPLEQWITLFFKAIYSPTLFDWKASQNAFYAAELAPAGAVMTNNQTTTPHFAPQDGGATLPALQEAKELEEKERGFLAKVGHLFSVAPVAQTQTPVSSSQFTMNDQFSSNNGQDAQQNIGVGLQGWKDFDDDKPQWISEKKLNGDDGRPEPEQSTVQGSTRTVEIPRLENITVASQQNIQQNTQNIGQNTQNTQGSDDQNYQKNQNHQREQEINQILGNQVSRVGVMGETHAKPGHAQPQAHSTTLRTSQAQQAEFSPDAAPPMVPELPNTLSGQVMDGEKHIISGAILEIQDINGLPVRAVKTNKAGHFLTVTSLENGTYTIMAEKENYKFDPVEFEAKGEIIAPIAIVAKGKMVKG